MEFRPIPEALLGPCEKKGTMTRFWYDTETYDEKHRPLRKDAVVYLPWGYEADEAKRYPVLFLMHGGGGSCNEFFGARDENGQVVVASPLKTLLDNAIASGRCAPMIVVTPSYTVEGVEEARFNIAIAKTLTHRFPTEMKNDLLPALSRAFRVIDDRWARAFGGFSMGGETTWSVMSECLAEIATYLPLSGDWWAIQLKGGKEYPRETADALIRKLESTGVKPGDFRVMAFTGDKDVAYEAMHPMVGALKERTDWFAYAESPQDGSLCYCLKENGEHTYEACYEYICLAMPYLFKQC